MLQNINRIAKDKDLHDIRRQLLNLKTKGSQIYSQHIPSHKNIIPSPSSDLNSQDIIRQRSIVNHSKLTLSLFHSRLNTVLYYWLKSSALLLNCWLFNWKQQYPPLCHVCFSTDETIQNVLFNCQALSEETISLKRFCFLAKIPNTYTAILNSNLPWHINCKIFKASVNILKRDKLFSVLLKHEEINWKGDDLLIDFDCTEESRSEKE